MSKELILSQDKYFIKRATLVDEHIIIETIGVHKDGSHLPISCISLTEEDIEEIHSLMVSE
jgi:hypothetical protein